MAWPSFLTQHEVQELRRSSKGKCAIGDGRGMRTKPCKDPMGGWVETGPGSAGTWWGRMVGEDRGRCYNFPVVSCKDK